MKKAYMKPEIMFESFAPAVSIALNCEVQPNHQATIQACGHTPEGALHSIFMEPHMGCFTKVRDGEYNGICYDSPNESWSLMNS